MPHFHVELKIVWAYLLWHRGLYLNCLVGPTCFSLLCSLCPKLQAIVDSPGFLFIAHCFDNETDGRDLPLPGILRQELSFVRTLLNTVIVNDKPLL
jgi:hypothetical protein